MSLKQEHEQENNQEQKEKQENEGKEKKKKKKRGIVLILLLLLAVLYAGITLGGKEKAPTDIALPEARPGVGELTEIDIDHMPYDEQIEYLKRLQQESMVTLDYSAGAIMKEGSKQLHLYVGNLDGMPNFYFNIMDGEEVLYTSPIVEPGKSVKVANLSKSLLQDTELELALHYTHNDTIVSTLYAPLKVSITN